MGLWVKTEVTRFGLQILKGHILHPQIIFKIVKLDLKGPNFTVPKVTPPKPENPPYLAHYFSKGVHFSKKYFRRKNTFGPQGAMTAVTPLLGYASVPRCPPSSCSQLHV